jgi:tetratricopeptide (TPR) repeat protein
MGAPLMSLALAALVFVSAGDTLASAGLPQPQPALRPGHDLPRLREWIDAVDRHIPGQPDRAAIVVGSWSRAQLEVLFLDLKSLVQLVTTPDRPRFPRALRDFTLPELQELQDLAAREAQAVNRLVKRAALLHTDIALLVPAAADKAAESAVPVPRPLLAPRSSVLVADGRQVGTSYWGTHWDFARLLFDEVKPNPAGDAAVRQWYRAVATFFENERLLSEARVHLERARQLFSADPEILAASGRLYETYAAPRIQNFLEAGGRVDNLPAAIGSSRSNLRLAETYFSKAVELDGSFAEARLHLGRVVGLQGHHEDAANGLRRAAVTAGDSRTQYYAWLFLGVEEQFLGSPDRARESFDKAAALYPLAQSPYLALSQLARRRGDRPGALRAIQHVLALPADHREREDPWWRFLDEGAADALTQLSEARAVLFLTPAER